MQNDPEIGPALREAQSKGPSGAMGLMNNQALMQKLQVNPLILWMFPSCATKMSGCRAQSQQLDTRHAWSHARWLSRAENGWFHTLLHAVVLACCDVVSAPALALSASITDPVP